MELFLLLKHEFEMIFRRFGGVGGPASSIIHSFFEDFQKNHDKIATHFSFIVVMWNYACILLNRGLHDT